MTLAAFERATSLDRLRHETFDLVVIGGGVTGAGVALDAASRGLKVALVERDDFSSGTSSKSSKLIHGGLRYLQQGDVKLVYEALAERQRLLTNAPHLVKLLPFLLPMFGKGGVIPAKIARLLGTAMWGYDLTGGFKVGKLHKRVTKSEALEYMPTLPAKNLVSGYLYFDAAADDSRLVVAICRTAALHHGAVMANRVTVTGLTQGAAGNVNGVTVAADGDEFTIATNAVVNAAGVWADRVRTLDEGTDPDSMRPAKGVHLTVPHHLVRNTIAAVIPVPKDRRSVFVVPHGEFTYIGTTDTDYDGSIDDPQCTEDDIDYLLSAINANNVNTITRDDIVGTWAGLRPLVKSASSGRTADLSRGHNIHRSPSGVVTITGGKLTTYRHMAADTVDEVVSEVLGARAPRGAKRSVTKKLRLRGADGYQSVTAAARGYGVTNAVADHLANRFGGEARAVMAMIKDDPTLAEPLVPGLPYVRAEAIFAVRHEMARSVDDVLSRRTRARLYGRADSAAAADAVAELIAPELGWSAAEAAASAAEFRALCEHERDAAGLEDVLLGTALATV
ncbi:MAG TPA: glycerol-3-phosphate dehydrogenase/oxidase [Microthrixaceae bacterium]|nr:glycerol-3-phosphate dehydrogenase/oxidase [Microthrixaceae bacterium]HQF93040.1 glycerol-3-phosphate dehydrogenase/oxidase [Microthrixaceae bacterium]